MPVTAGKRRSFFSMVQKEEGMSFTDLQGPLSQVFSTSPRGILVLNSHGRAVFVNPRGQSLLGIRHDGSEPFRDAELIRDGLRVDSIASLEGLPFKEILDSRRPVTEARLNVTYKEGVRGTLVASGYPLFGDSGRIDEVVFVIDDALHGGMQGESMLEGEARFRTVFDNAPIGIVHFDSHGTITACNESNAQIFGADRDRIVGLNLGKDLTDKRMKAAYETCRSGEIGHFEGEYVSVAGNKPIVARAAFVPFISSSGSYSGGIELVEDITERRKMEEMLEWELKVNTAIAEISGSLIAPSVPVGKIAEIVLEHVKMITASKYGYISSVDRETGDVTAYVADYTEAAQGAAQGPGERLSSIWAEALKGRKAFYADAPRKKASSEGIATGPACFTRFLYVPALDGNDLVGQIAVGDSHRAYSDKDLEAVEKLAHLYTLSLQRKNVERKIERLASFPELNPYPIIEVDFSGKVTYHNEATVETLRCLDCPEAPELFFPFDMDDILNKFRGAEAQRLYREVAIGTSTFGEDIFHPSDLKAIRIYARDITEKKHSEKALQASHDLLEVKVQGRTKELMDANQALDDARALLEKVVVAVDQVEEGVAIADQGGLIEYVNPAFERLTGRTRKELLGERIVRTVDGDIRATMEEVLSEGRVWSGRFSRDISDGSRCEIGISLAPVKDTSGRITNYVDVERDITRQVKLEAELHQTEKLEAIGTLAGGIAHDFNNIIAGIIGFTEIMLEDTSEESPMYRRLALVLKGAHRGKNLVDQILSFSRRRKAGMKPVSLTRAIEETVEAMRPALPAAVELRRDIAVREGLILGDSVQIHQMLANLYANALYAMKEHGGLLLIRLDRADQGEMVFSSSEELPGKPWIQLTVSDTGCGMEKSTAERAFEPFFTTRGPGEGSGMGLSVVHGIVRRHDGVIRVESQPGKGAAFHLFFPEYEGAPEVEAEGLAGIPGGTERILVVDDEVLITEMSRQRLERLGYTVGTAASAREALDVLKSDPEYFDLVITDYSMPEATGTDLARDLARIRPDMPVILCSGLNEVVAEEDIKTLHVSDFFMKPISKREFAQLVRTVLDRARCGT
jgi:PAS domain S-box-containing protein